MKRLTETAAGGQETDGVTNVARRRIPRLGLFKVAAGALAGVLGVSLAEGIGIRSADAAATTGSSFAAYGTDTTYTGDPTIGFDASDSNAGFDTGVSGSGTDTGVAGSGGSTGVSGSGETGVSGIGTTIGVVGLTGLVVDDAGIRKSPDEAIFTAGILGLGASGKLPGGVPYKKGTGVFAYAGKGGVGVDAYGSGGIGVHGTTKSDENPAILGQNNAGGAGVNGISAAGVGGVFEGEEAAIRLIPAKSASHPRKGQVGELMLDASHRLWFCKRGGDPAVWTQLA